MATTTHGVPYPLGTDNNDAASDMQAIAEFLDERMWTPGDIKASVRSTAQTGWAKIDGSTLTNAQTTYPDLWAVAPASWKSGSDLVLPDWCGGTEGAALRGADLNAVGETSSANSQTLSSANLPPHQHTIDHDHASASTSSAGSHSHSPGSLATASAGTHSHGGIEFATQFINRNLSSLPSDGNWDVWEGLEPPGSTNSAGAHTHSITGTTSSGGSHSHSLNLPNFTGNSGNGGFANTAIDTRGKSGHVNFFIRLT